MAIHLQIVTSVKLHNAMPRLQLLRRHKNGRHMLQCRPWHMRPHFPGVGAHRIQLWNPERQVETGPILGALIEQAPSLAFCGLKLEAWEVLSGLRTVVDVCRHA